MLKRERQNLILREVNLHNKVISSILSEKLDVSEDTIRRDLNELAEDDKVVKVRGGALSKSFHIYSYRENDIYKYEEKTTIARKAVSMLREGMHVLISGGTTNLELARIIPDELKITFYTVSLPTALQLAEHQNCETIFIGGRISCNSKISTGGQVINSLRDIRPDLCFLGANGINSRIGLTESDWDIVDVKKSMIAASNKLAILTLSDKLESAQKIRICGMDAVDYLITEQDPDSPMLQPFIDAGTTIL